MSEPNDEPQLPVAVVPYLAVVSGAEALDYYATAMGAEENARMTNDDGRWRMRSS